MDVEMGLVKMPFPDLRFEGLANWSELKSADTSVTLLLFRDHISSSYYHHHYLIF